MAKFSYKVKNTAGQTLTGTIDASDSGSVFKVLRDQGLFVIDIQASLPAFLLSRLSFRLKSIGMNEVTNFTRQLAVMLSTGLTLTEGLAILHNQANNTGLKKLFSDLIVDIEGGLSFSKALSRYKHIFPESYTAVVRSGETAGLLDKMLNRLADNLEKERDFRAKTRGALVYPIIIVIGMGIVITIMMIFVIPQLSSLYGQLNVELPLPTRIIVAISNFFVNFWYIVIAFVVFSFFAFSSWKKTESGKSAIDAVFLKIPVLGKLQRDSNLTELTRTLSLLVGTGTPIIDALQNISLSAKNRLFGEALSRIAKKIEKGLSLGMAFSQEPLMPPLIAQMARVGEETGKLDEVMNKVSEYFEGEAERTVKALTTLLEPIILVILGVGVGFLIISVILPIYNLTNAF